MAIACNSPCIYYFSTSWIFGSKKTTLFFPVIWICCTHSLYSCFFCERNCFVAKLASCFCWNPFFSYKSKSCFFNINDGYNLFKYTHLSFFRSYVIWWNFRKTYSWSKSKERNREILILYCIILVICTYCSHRSHLLYCRNCADEFLEIYSRTLYLRMTHSRNNYILMKFTSLKFSHINYRIYFTFHRNLID